MRGHFMFMRMI